MKYQLFPIPKLCTFYQGSLSLVSHPHIHIDSEILNSCTNHGYEPERAITDLFQVSGQKEAPSCAVNVNYLDCHPEAFSLEVSNTGIQIQCSQGAGLFYAIASMNQLAAQGGDTLPFLSLMDEPALNIRGIMLDIGRDKIPSMDTLRTLLDRFAAMRINHVQMYMEGFCFQYETYQYLFANETPMTSEEFEELSIYAKARFIDLVPNQNVLGHMEKWLEKPQFNHLAECEDGYLFENIYWRPPMTLDVKDPESFQLAKTLLSVLLDHSKSDYINVNMDEPFELGAGKNKEAAEKSGRMELYFEYLEKLNAYCQARGKTMMMWGDEILHHPGCVSRFPKDVTLLDWIYEGDADFTTHAKLMQQTGLSFCLCPGTSSWGSLTGRHDNMKKNIRNAAEAALEYGAEGMITTDWGDLGHWQYLSVSYPAYTYAASCSWSGKKGDSEIVSWYCSRFLYQCFDNSAWKAAWNLGNYYHLEQAPLYNTTLAFAVMSSKYPFDSIGEFDAKMARLLKLSANIAGTNNIPAREAVISIDYSAMNAWLLNTRKDISAMSIQTPEGELIREEMENGLRMVSHGIHLYYTMKELRDDTDKFKKEMAALFTDLDEIMKIHYRLWIARNRAGGFERSTRHMVYLLNLYRSMGKSLT